MPLPPPDRELLKRMTPFASSVGVVGAAAPFAPSGGGAVAGAFYADSSTPSSGVVSATMVGWDALVDTSLTVDVVLASEVLYDSSEVVSLARSAAHLLKDGSKRRRTKQQVADDKQRAAEEKADIE